LAEVLFHRIPAGVGSTGKLHMDRSEMDAMLAGGARWAVAKGYGVPIDLDFIEEHGCMEGAMPECVSDHAKTRQQDEMGTLGSGNHYLEVQQVVNVFATEAASAFDLHEGDIVVSIHCGSRGLGHQIGTEFAMSQRSLLYCRPRTGLCPDQLGSGTGISRRDAGGHQLRPREPLDHHPSGPAGVCRHTATSQPLAALRRLA
jgi:tRNA-splicing ligase RtcB